MHKRDARKYCVSARLLSTEYLLCFICKTDNLLLFMTYAWLSFVSYVAV